VREALPNRRQNETYDFAAHGNLFTGSIARFADGRIAEIFLHGEKVGSTGSLAARDAAVAASLALQFGCPVDVLRHALTRLSDGSAAGPLGELLDIVAGGAP
jgi:hypothetical protein